MDTGPTLLQQMPTREKSIERPWKKSPRCHSNMLACNRCPQHPHCKYAKVLHLHVLSDKFACNLTRCKSHNISTDMHTTYPILSHTKRHRKQMPSAHSITAWSAHCTIYLVLLHIQSRSCRCSWPRDRHLRSKCSSPRALSAECTIFIISCADII